MAGAAMASAVLASAAVVLAPSQTALAAGPSQADAQVDAQAGSTAAALPACAAGNICFTADDTEYRRNRVLLHNIVIYQGGSVLRIGARSAEASSLDFADSTWTLEGAVQVRTLQGQLAADRATVHFVASRLGGAIATGTPANFEQEPAAAEDAGRAAHGHARTIDYDPQAGEVRLNGEAFLTNGCNEISGERIVYEFALQRVHAQGAGGARVQGTIRPECRPAHPASGVLGSGAPGGSVPGSGTP
jgi:lipopolysaccharide transport protein LptA